MTGIVVEDFPHRGRWKILYTYLLPHLVFLLFGGPAVHSLEVNERHITDQWEYKYRQEIDDTFVVREYLLMEVHPRTAFLCPKGFAIAKLTSLIETNREYMDSFPDKHFQVPFSRILVEVDDGLYYDNSKDNDFCPTLSLCLGYQACLFNYGNEFCHQDPVPGQRKMLNVNLTCLQEELFLEALTSSKPQEEVSDIQRKFSLVKHLTYTSRLEEGVQDYSQTVIREREEKEELVFRGHCPSLDESVLAGYRGACDNEPLDPMEVAESLWSLLGRVPQPECRKELEEIFCAFQYNSYGLCLPPYTIVPGQVSGLKPEGVKLNQVSTPNVGPRPKVSKYQKSLKKIRHLSLIPVRLGFVLLTHKDPPAIMQMLSLVYRPEHFYVIHVDYRSHNTRETLKNLLELLYPKATNIRILPASRSVVASWGSFNIVRAELECFEELLRMGIWDFVVKMSGSDLPLRDVDDLAATLAPYRGTSFVPLFGQRNINLTADQGLALDVWHGCQGYVYNVTRSAGQPPPEDLKIYTGSQWSLVGYNLAAYSVDPAKRWDIINRFYYHMQTSIIPDESFFPTMAFNSPYWNKSAPIGFHFLKQFEGHNAINLCRHMEDTDFCGRGPGPFVDEDIHELAEASHRHFFARKFPTTDPKANIRIKVIEHVRTTYYQSLNKHLHKAILNQLARKAFPQLAEELRSHPILKNLATMAGGAFKYRILPRLHVVNPCCSLPFEWSFKSTQEFTYAIDFHILEEETGEEVGAARAMVVPRAMCDCYPDGHLRAIRCTTWAEGEDILSRRAMSTNMPFPFAMPGSDAVYVEMWFHVGVRSTSSDCLKQARAPGVPMEFPNPNFHEVKADPLSYVIQLIDPEGNVRCQESKTEVWSPEVIYPNRDGERVEMASFTAIICSPMEPGTWTLRVVQEGVQNARRYEMPIVVLPMKHELPPDAEELRKIDLLQGLWTIDDAMILPVPDIYEDKPVLPTNEEKPFVHKPKQSSNKTKTTKEEGRHHQKNEPHRTHEEEDPDLESRFRRGVDDFDETIDVFQDPLFPTHGLADAAREESVCQAPDQCP
ncbi:uncharacterized protein LOC143033436 isoform X2 [Oratosquilla oratoria]|uniref:uncharacterized protein LOC143033436 isoform X2 n=1 Tax=Oratosquilla oratoria TaxID=337810 RepID=UPI003F7701FD